MTISVKYQAKNVPIVNAVMKRVFKRFNNR